MNARELSEQWEQQAKKLRVEAQREHDDRARLDRELVADINDLRAAELRAALPEQPLSRKWRERIEQYRKDADDSEEATAFALIQAGKIIGTQDCLADLDSHESESRELLRRIVIAADSFNGTRPDMNFEAHVHALGELMKAVDEARKHLGGESDEA